MMRNLLLIPTVLLTGLTATAQLYVAPNGSQDSYIYVNDNVIYVEDEISLTENTNDPATEASIFLRNESQLVQGAGTDDNTGSGYISVMQNSRSDAYDYNFWASPVGNPTGNGNQPFQMVRVKDSLTVTDSKDSGVIGGFNGRGSGMGGNANSNPLRISQRWLYKWESGSSWQYVGGSGTVSPGYGFTMKGTNVTTHANPFEDPNNQKYDFRGRPNKGDFTYVIPGGPDGVLAGNPYPSALDLNQVFVDNGFGAGGVDLVIRFWDEDRTVNSHLYVDNKGGYGSWIPDGVDGPGFYTAPVFINYDSAGNPIGGNNGSGQSIERRYAPIGQGFFLTSTGGETITVNNSQRAYIKEGAANDSQFRDMVNGGNSLTAVAGIGNDQTDAEEEQINRIPSLHVRTEFAQDGEVSHTRDMILILNPDSTRDYDPGMEAPHPMDAGGGEAFFRVPSDIQLRRKLVIQSRPFDPEDQIRYTVKLDHQMKVAITSDKEVELPRPMYIWDSEEDTYQQFTGGKSAVYVLPAGTYENRFFIVYKGEREMQQIAEDFEESIRSNIGVFQNNTVSRLEVSNPEGYDITQANIFDINGRLIISENNVGNSRRYSLPTSNLSDGVYIVKLTTTENVEVDYKISVFNKR